MFGLLPKNLEFFDCFERAAVNALHCAELLADFVARGNFADQDRVTAIEEVEHNGDKITHETLDRLERTYITPIDRDDIYRLITRIDDVVDSMDAIGQRMFYYKVQLINNDFPDQCTVLVKAVRSMVAAVGALRHMKNRGKAKSKTGSSLDELIIAVHAAEEEGDSIYHKVLGELFEGGLEVFQVMKWKELHELVEQAIDFCDDVACLMHSIVLKNV